jgi:hypothetical protein
MGKKANPFKRPVGPFEYRDALTRIVKLQEITDLQKARDAQIYCASTDGVQQEVRYFAAQRLKSFERWMKSLGHVLVRDFEFTPLGISNLKPAAWFPLFAKGYTPVGAAAEVFSAE